MHRRTVLRSLCGGGVAALAGCVTSPEQSSAPTESHTVRVTRRRETRAGVVRELRVDEGELGYEVQCPDGTTESASTTLSDDEWAAFETLVLDADPSSFDPRYECAGDCPGDVPPVQVTFQVDGDRTDVLVEATADATAELQQILSRLEDLQTRIDAPGCN